MVKQNRKFCFPKFGITVSMLIVEMWVASLKTSVVFKKKKKKSKYTRNRLMGRSRTVNIVCIRVPSAF